MKTILFGLLFLLVSSAHAQNYMGFLVLDSRKTLNQGFIEADPVKKWAYKLTRVGQNVKARSLLDGRTFTLNRKGKKWLYSEKGTYRSQGARCEYTYGVTLSKYTPRKATFRFAIWETCATYYYRYREYKGTIFRF